MHEAVSRFLCFLFGRDREKRFVARICVWRKPLHEAFGLGREIE
jgi:hypothetical protein